MSQVLEKKLQSSTIILIILFLYVTVGRIVETFLSYNSIRDLVSIETLFTIVLVLALVGIVVQKKWGSILAALLLIIGFISDVLGIAFGKQDMLTGIAQILLAALILFLLFREYKRLEVGLTP